MDMKSLPEYMQRILMDTYAKNTNREFILIDYKPPTRTKKYPKMQIQLNPPKYMSNWVLNSDFKLYPYQKDLVEKAIQISNSKSKNYDYKLGRSVSIRGLYLQDDCGLGKTLQAVETMVEFWRNHPEINYPSVIVCPKTVKIQWAESIKELYPNAIVRKGFTYLNPAKDNKYFIVIHFEQARKMWDDIQPNEDDEIDEDVFEERSPDLYNTQIAVCVIDEAHKCRSMKVRTTKAIRDIKADFLLPMSATPFDKDPAEQWAMLNMLDSASFPSFDEMQKDHTILRMTSAGRKALGIRDIKKYKNATKHIVLQRTRLQVAPDLQEPIQTKVRLEFANDQEAFYTKLRAGYKFENLLDSENPFKISGILSEIMRRQQATSNPSLLPIDGNSCSNSKFEWLKEHLENSESDMQYLIQVRFRGTAQMIYKWCIENQFTAGILQSGSNATNQNENIFDPLNPDSFDAPIQNVELDATQEDVVKAFKQQHIRILVAVIESGGTGLDFRRLPKVNTIFYDIHWSNIKMVQAMKRTIGIVETEQRQLFYLVCLNTVDELIYRSFKDKYSTYKLCEEFEKNNGKY